MDIPTKAHELISKREREILALAAQGCTNQEIAERLSITRTTARTHLSHIYKKLCVRSRTEAVVKYFFTAESSGLIFRQELPP